MGNQRALKKKVHGNEPVTSRCEKLSTIEQNLSKMNRKKNSRERGIFQGLREQERLPNSYGYDCKKAVHTETKSWGK